MTSGSNATLIMTKTLNRNVQSDEKTYFCKVLSYDVKQECIYLVLESDSLSAISLDAIYKCKIYETENKVSCTGRIRERFQNQYGNIVKLKIENGFYKINLKSVDKQ